MPTVWESSPASASASPRTLPSRTWAGTMSTSRRDHPAVANIPPNYQFYFVHSYYVRPASDDMTLGVTDYGGSFASVVARGKLIATQFHPEKSGRPGLALYRDFFNWAI